MRRVHVLSFLSILSLACTPKDGDVEDTLGQDTTTGPTSLGDGDGDPSGDGDGDPSGDGDGDPSGDGDGDGDGDPSGDGDGDPSGDGDGDPTGNDGCSDGGDSGNAPFDDDPVLTPADPDDEAPAEPHGGFGVFVPDEDIGGVNECDIFDQDCPDGEKCVPYASSGGTWDANKCVPIMGDQMVGEACTYGGVVEATDDCDATSLCWGVDNQGEGTCTAMCQGSEQDPICPEGTLCNISNMGSIAICEPECNPLTQDCPEGDACFWSGDAFSCVYTTADIEAGQPCGFINDCAKGLMCVSGELVPGCNGASCCAEYCDLDCGEGVCSTPGTSCVAFFGGGQSPAGDEDIGVCILP